MRKLRYVLTELKHLLEFAVEGHVNRVELIGCLILAVIGIGTLIVGLIWVFSM